MATPYDQLLNQLYQEELGRTPDVEGAAFWANALAGGLSEADLQRIIAQSPEAQQFRTNYVTSLYQDMFGRAPDQAGLQFWLEGLSGAMTQEELRNAFARSPEGVITNIYQDQLGRFAALEGGGYWGQQLEAGRSVEEIAQALNQSLEGQNFDTQVITSLYRQNLQRNPEQEGFQYWLSIAQNLGFSPSQLEEAFKNAAVREQVDRGIDPATAFTNVQVADLEADPHGGRYLTQSIYDLAPNAVNVSTIGGRQAQFVAPVTQRSVVSQYDAQSRGFTATTGLDVLNTPAVQSAIQRAFDSGVMTPEEYRTMYADLQAARNMQDVYAAFNKPQAQVVIDAVFGQQTGEANTLAQAQAEAAQRQAVLDATGRDFYQSNAELARAYQAAGLNFPFTADNLGGYDTRTTQANVVNNANFNQQVNNLLRTLYGEFGGREDMVTPLTGQYYSETGLQPAFTPVGGQGTMFRSGVAGYTPNLPSMFQFGMPPVDTSFRQYAPGAFQPEGVTTGGYITGYTQDGIPIYSTLANPNVNVEVPQERLAAQKAWETGPITQQNFDAVAYLRDNPDVARNAVYGSNPYQHYLDYGRNEPGRVVTRLPFSYTQTSQLVNPATQAAILPTTDLQNNSVVYSIGT